MKELTVAYTVHKGFEFEPQATQRIRVFLKGGIGAKRSSNIREFQIRVYCEPLTAGGDVTSLSRHV